MRTIPIPLPVFRMSYLLLSLFLLYVLSVSRAQPDGWKMTDRFYGFRYELSSSAFSATFNNDVQKHADDMGCFGWIQDTSDRKKVGEVRCSKMQGPKFESWISKELQKSPDVHAVIKVYSDSKIRLHFSHFKILEENRDTCFTEPPHQCSTFATDTPSTRASTSSNTGEL